MQCGCKLNALHPSSLSMFRKLSSSVMQTSVILPISLHSKWVSCFLLLKQLPSWCPWATHKIILATNPTPFPHTKLQQAKVKYTWIYHWSSCCCSGLVYASVPRSCCTLHRFACYRETFAFSMANRMTHPPAIQNACEPYKVKCEAPSGNKTSLKSSYRLLAELKNKAYKIIYISFPTNSTKRSGRTMLSVSLKLKSTNSYLGCNSREVFKQQSFILKSATVICSDSWAWWGFFSKK